MEVVAETGSEAYVSLLRRVLSEGEPTAPRDQQTLELLDVTVFVANLESAHVFDTVRKVSRQIAATEYVQLLAGVSSLEQLDLASGGRFTQFADDGRLMGAYGPRIRHQLPKVVDLLRRDPDTRQAVLTIWRGQEHNGVFKDVPCTLAVQFLLRDNHLNVRVAMRSNDVILGVPYDWFMFSRLGLSVASALGVEPGSYTHTVGSTHLYDRDLGIANDVEYAGVNRSVTVVPAITYDGSMTDPQFRVKALQSVARGICLGYATDDWETDHPGTDWHRTYVPKLTDVGTCVGCHYVVKTADLYAEDTDFCKLCG